MTVMDNAQAAAIAEEFPGWEAWAGLINGLWHARIVGAVPPVMVHAETADGIREQIQAYTATPWAFRSAGADRAAR
jgi:hypothetical protein